MLIVNVMLGYTSTTSELIEIFGSTTSPAYIFLIPSYLFYHYSRSNNSVSNHRKFSYAMYIGSLLIIVFLTTISVYLFRINVIVDLTHKHKQPHDVVKDEDTKNYF